MESRALSQANGRDNQDRVDPLGVNVGASTSQGVGLGRSPRGPVRFLDLLDRLDPLEEDRESVVSEKSATPENFKTVMRLLFQLCPDAAPEVRSTPQKSCVFEGIFAHTGRPQREEMATKLFHRVREVLGELVGRLVVR